MKRTAAEIVDRIDDMMGNRGGPGGYANELPELRDWIRPWEEDNIPEGYYLRETPDGAELVKR